jgi:large subunit ribosomal protein L18
MKVKTKQEYRRRRHLRVRRKIRGTAERPRLAVYVSNRHLYAQLIDDDRSHTLASISTMSNEFSGERNTRETAGKLGARIADLAKGQGIEQVVFDRGGFAYGTRLRTLADAVREAGLNV